MKNAKITIRACFAGYIVQAVVNNFLPLLFVELTREFAIPLSEITLLVTFNFGIQLVIDLCSAPVIRRFGYRFCLVFAHVMAAAGLLLLSFLPDHMDPMAGVLISVLVYATGGGFLEVMISPVVESCPSDNKEAAMSLLHSFYCWGQLGVVLLSTLYFHFAGISSWRLLAALWAILPVANGILFCLVPLYPVSGDDESGMRLPELAKSGPFWLLFILMLCAGASEQAVSQWASTFAETGLHVSKSIGDLAGPSFFALLMGTSRAFYGVKGQKIKLLAFMEGSALLCITSYLLISLSPVAALSLFGCGLAGLSVGILWPGTFSIAAKVLPKGGTMLYALLALAGDLGCSAGPTLTGFVAAGSDLRHGILSAIVFPLVMFLGCLAVQRQERPAKR